MGELIAIVIDKCCLAKAYHLYHGRNPKLYIYSLFFYCVVTVGNFVSVESYCARLRHALYILV